MMKILYTPVSFSYVHLSEILVYIWICTVPRAIVSSVGWFAVPITILLCSALLGINMASNEIEIPFGRDYNDLPMEKFEAGVQRDILRLTEDEELPYCWRKARRYSGRKYSSVCQTGFQIPRKASQPALVTQDTDRMSLVSVSASDTDEVSPSNSRRRLPAEPMRIPELPMFNAISPLDLRMPPLPGSLGTTTVFVRLGPRRLPPKEQVASLAPLPAAPGSPSHSTPPAMQSAPTMWKIK
eukprot:NODE_2416_length_929_cov_78.406818_g1987_i0.p1 GENE.NODE_2416_length_929_cov_78.406818_g1987_i0~~NODE_2416_length_929_cov_78.406818_g1987_i0.p1  ORF type:complete len:255 (+),score=48.50 NODE_2416_length_929_cov_78.406818_g1987_i0:46-765(+)